MAQTVSFVVLAPSAPSEAQVFLPQGSSYQPFRFAVETYEVRTAGPSMGFGSPSASKPYSPPTSKE